MGSRSTLSTTPSSRKRSRWRGPSCDPLKKFLAKKRRQICSKRFLENRFPCIAFGRSYSLDYFINDVIAGLTLALTVIPMGIGYAALAELPLQVSISLTCSHKKTYLSFWKEKMIQRSAVNLDRLLSRRKNIARPPIYLRNN